MAITLDGNNASTVGVINSATAKASTSGTSIDFTGIPAGVKRITVMFNGVSTNGTSLIQVQVGAGSATTTGYTAGVQNSSTFTANSTGFPVANTIAASDTVYGALILELITSNTWVGQGTFLRAAINVNVSSGSVALGGTLDRVRITTVNGTDTFDAGSINILYE